MPLPQDDITDDLYAYFVSSGEEIWQMRLGRYIIVITLPEIYRSGNRTYGNIEIYNGKEDVTLSFFPTKEDSRVIPATTNNLFGVMSFIKRKEKNDE
jgi:hypothetical protein